MSPRLAPVLGAVAGIAAAALVIAGLVAFLPEPVPSPTPVPTPIPSLPSLGAGSSASAAASGAPDASATSAPSLVTSPLPSSSESDALFHVGQPAPPLRVPNVAGGTIDLAAQRGKPVWLSFMATWCPSCRDELPLMNGFAARYAGEDLTVIAVDVREPADLVRPYMTSLKVVFPVGLDEDGRAVSAWGAFALPVHFWIDAQGIVRQGALGGIGPDVMVEGLQRIMPGVSVTP